MMYPLKQISILGQNNFFFLDKPPNKFFICISELFQPLNTFFNFCKTGLWYKFIELGVDPEQGGGEAGKGLWAGPRGFSLKVLNYCKRKDV